MDISSIFFFLAVLLGIGYSASRFVPESPNFLERNLMRLGIGLGAFLFLSLLLNLLRIPLDWKIFLAIGLAVPLYSAFKKIKNFDLPIPILRLSKYDLRIIIMMLIFAVSMYIYTHGAFSYPYLEDDDSWSHAMSAKYVSDFKTLFEAKNNLHYIDPYPPAYSALMGIIHQTNSSVYWTLKFFNAFIISLSVIFFYFFMNEFTGDYNRALFSTFALASVPAFLSHFIWSISLSIPMYFVSLYCLEKMRSDKKWLYLSAMMISATLVISPTHSTYFGIFFALYYITKVILERNLQLDYAMAGIFGVFGSLLLWWGPMIIKHGIYGTLQGVGLAVGRGETIFGVIGTVEKYYTLRDFLIAKSTNMINNPIGIGMFLSLLAAIALIVILTDNYKKLRSNKMILILGFFIPVLTVPITLFSLFAQKPGNPLNHVQFFMNFKFMIFGLTLILAALLLSLFQYFKSPEKQIWQKWKIITLVWLFAMFYAVNAANFQIKISAFRAWMLFAIPMSIISSEGMWFLIGKFGRFRALKYLAAGFLVLGIIFTSAAQKYSVNTAQWPPGGFWTSYEEISGYVWLKDNLPPNTKVFTFVNSGAVIGMDKYICRWCPDEMAFQENGFKNSPAEIRKWLNGKNYEYFVIDGGTVKKFGINETNLKLQEIASSGDFMLVRQNPAFFLFKVR